MTHCWCIYRGVSNAWSHHTQETSQNFSSWVRGFFPLFEMKFSKSVYWLQELKFSSWRSPVLMSFFKPSLSLFDLVTKFYFRHQIYTCIIFDPQWYCSSLMLGYFEWCLKQLFAILQLTGHHLILLMLFPLGLCITDSICKDVKVWRKTSNCSRPVHQNVLSAAPLFVASRAVLTSSKYRHQVLWSVELSHAIE